MKKPKKPPKVRLQIIDRGIITNLGTCRDVYLIEGEHSTECWLYHCDVSAAFADRMAEWAESVGLEVQRVAEVTEPA